jgi:hypothetical protein
MRAPTLRLATFASLFAVSGFVACGGGSFTSGTTSSGSGGGAMSSASAGGATASAGGGSTVAAAGGAGGATSSTTTGGGGSGGGAVCGIPCPETPPTASNICECVDQECTFVGKCPTTPELTVVCAADHTWTHASTKPCCGDVTCQDGEVCLSQDVAGTTQAPQCAPIQCNGTPDCECVSKLCGMAQTCKEDAGLFYCQGPA